MGKNKTLEFRSVSALRACLQSHGIPLDKWGKGDARTVQEVYTQYREGERIFEIDKLGLLCDVHRAQAVITHGDEFLCELFKVRCTGEIQLGSTAISVSEKLRAGETPREGLERCFLEELGIPLETARQLDLGDFGTRTRMARSSRTSPGLRTRRHDHVFRWEMPAAFYSRLGYREDQPSKTHYFLWLPKICMKRKLPRI